MYTTLFLSERGFFGALAERQWQATGETLRKYNYQNLKYTVAGGKRETAVLSKEALIL